MIEKRIYEIIHEEEPMKKTIIAVLAASLILTGCESLAEGVLSGMANANSSSTEAGQIYYFYNESSYTVTIMDPTGNLTIPPGGNIQIRYNRQVSIYSVDYSPADRVVPSQSSGTHITFRDR
jgi:uncharacterized lipoprotein NlpE involved in copper resistance